jgi:hypothetical protein
MGQDPPDVGCTVSTVASASTTLHSTQSHQPHHQMPSPNRDKGHRFECALAVKFRLAGFKDAATARGEGSKGLDDAGVDLVDTGDFMVQAKHTKTAPNMHTLLDSMPKEGRHFIAKWATVFHKRSNKGVTVTMTEETFFAMVKEIKDLKCEVNFLCEERAGEDI